MLILVDCALDIIAPDGCTSLSEAVAMVVEAAGDPPSDETWRIGFSEVLLDQPNRGHVLLFQPVIRIPTAPVNAQGQRAVIIDGDIDGDGEADVVLDANADGDNDPNTSSPVRTGNLNSAFRSIFSFGSDLDENLVVRVRDIGLTGALSRSRGLASAPLTPDNAPGHGPAVFGYRTNLTLSNVTIFGNFAGSAEPIDQNGYAMGGGVYVHEGPVAVYGSTLRDNRAKREGGAVAVPGGSVILSDSTVERNFSEAGTGGAVFAERGTVVRSRVERNWGGGLGLGAAASLVVDTTVRRNQPFGVAAAGDLRVVRATVENHCCDGGAGLRAGGALSLEDSVVTGNVARDTAADVGRGGGVRARVATISGSRVVGNAAEGPGGGVYALSVTVAGSLIADNFGGPLGGGGIWGNAVTLVDSEVSGNRTLGDRAPGGGVSARTLRGENVLIADNRTEGDDSPGGGVYATLNVFLANATVAGNGTGGARSPGGGIGFDSSSGRSGLVNATVTGNWTVGAASAGAGLDARSASAFSVANTLVAGNLARGAASSEIAGEDRLGPVRGSILGVPSGASPASLFRDVETVTVWTAGGPEPTTTQRGALADNGGPTRTVAIGAYPVDRGSTDAARGGDGAPLATDQRGEGFDRVRGAAVDVGAFEAP